MKNSFAQIHDQAIHYKGHPIQLRGINLGNWLLLEHFMIGLPSIERNMRRELSLALGQDRSAQFWQTYRENYITEKDIAYLASLDANLIRVAFNYSVFEDDQQPGVFKEESFLWLDKVIALCEKHDMLVLLDLHAAPGGQDLSYNADNDNPRPLFWEEKTHRDRAINLWQCLAARYCENSTVFGYDLLNEPCLKNGELLSSFYRECIAAIREIDSDHIIVLEGDLWSKDPQSLAPDLFDDPQVMPSVHYYLQFDVPLKEMNTYPQTVNGETIDRERIKKGIQRDCNFGDLKRPILIGEFGARKGQNLLYQMYQEVISIYEELGFHWTLWSYKDQGQMCLVSPKQDTPWLQFVNNPKWHTLRQKIKDYLSVDFSYGATQTSLLGKAMPELFTELEDEDFVLRNLSQAAKIMEMPLLRMMTQELAKQDDDTLQAMAASFHFDQCEINSDAEALMRSTR